VAVTTTIWLQFDCCLIWLQFDGHSPAYQSLLRSQWRNTSMAADPLATVIYLGSSAAAHTCTSMVVTFWLNCSRIENKFKSNSSCNHHLNHCVITACCHSQLIHRDIFEFNIFLIWVLVCWWWRYDWSFACLIAAVVTTTSVILSSNKIQNRDTLVRAYPGCPLINEHSYSFQRILQNNWKHTHAHTHQSYPTTPARRHGLTNCQTDPGCHT